MICVYCGKPMTGGSALGSCDLCGGIGCSSHFEIPEGSSQRLCPRCLKAHRSGGDMAAARVTAVSAAERLDRLMRENAVLREKLAASRLQCRRFRKRLAAHRR